MRNACVNALIEAAEKDKDIFLLTGDLGFSVLEPFRERYPSQFINGGVAEQSMIGIAAGLASCGKKVFVYSLGNFPTFRCLEQIRNDVCFHNLNVTIIATGCGFHYGTLGFTHHATSDIAIMRALPNIKIIAPNDAAEAERAVKELIKNGGPCYLRLASANGIFTKENKFEIGKASIIREGKDVSLLATGGMLSLALEAANALKSQGIDAEVISFHTIKPFDTEALLNSANRTRRIITIEEHSIIGGLGSTVAEALCLNECKARFKSIGIPDAFAEPAGSRDYLRKKCGLDANNIANLAREMANKNE